VKPYFRNFDTRAAIETCELDYDRVREVARIYATRKSSLRYDLGFSWAAQRLELVPDRHPAGDLRQALRPGSNVINGT